MTSAELKSKLSKSVGFLESELAKIRTGRANPAVLEEIAVSVYGSIMKIKELASISVADVQTLVVSPWDKGVLKDIVKGIVEAGVNLNPVIDGDVVRVPIPDLTQERRDELVKVVSAKSEESKGTLRSIRQEAMRDIDKSFNSKLIGEDEKFTLRDEVEDLVKKYISEIDGLVEDKKKNLLRV